MVSSFLTLRTLRENVYCHRVLVIDSITRMSFVLYCHRVLCCHRVLYCHRVLEEKGLLRDSLNLVHSQRVRARARSLLCTKRVCVYTQSLARLLKRLLARPQYTFSRNVDRKNPPPGGVFYLRLDHNTLEHNCIACRDRVVRWRVAHMLVIESLHCVSRICIIIGIL